MRYLDIALFTSLLVGTPALGATLLNPGFELADGTGAAQDWSDSALYWGFTRCTIAQCGDGLGTVAPHSGDAWAWFGGTAFPESATVSQSVLIEESAVASLSFHLWYGVASQAPEDTFTASIDGVPLLVLLGSDLSTTSYQYYSYDISGYADGGAHEIRFQLLQNGAATMNVSLDDVSLATATATAAIPEPSTLLLGMSGLAVFAMIRSQRSKE